MTSWNHSEDFISCTGDRRTIQKWTRCHGYWNQSTVLLGWNLVPHAACAKGAINTRRMCWAGTSVLALVNITYSILCAEHILCNRFQGRLHMRWLNIISLHSEFDHHNDSLIINGWCPICHVSLDTQPMGTCQQWITCIWILYLTHNYLAVNQKF